MSWTEFYKKARVLGHAVDRLNEGEEVVSYTTLADLEKIPSILSSATKEERKIRQQTFFHPALLARQRLGQGRHDRGEAVMFADARPEERDAEGIGIHLPLHLKSISVKEKIIKAGEEWDVSVRREQWGLDPVVELYTVVNIGRLVIEPEAKVVVKGNVFALLCQELVVQSGENTDFHIGILPTPFSIDFKRAPLNGRRGVDGESGVPGRPGYPLQVMSSILGYRLMVPFREGQLDGTDGTDGKDGTDGGCGQNGGACKIAEITIRHLEGRLIVFAQAGKGGDGMKGGNGGHGGDGGNAEKGCKLSHGFIPDGKAGDGGCGGCGGHGGHGGNGGISSNIYIGIPEGCEGNVLCRVLPSEGGKPGCGGLPGKGGTGGLPDGENGIDGLQGKNGYQGHSRPAPALFLNNHLLKPKAYEKL